MKSFLTAHVGNLPEHKLEKVEILLSCHNALALVESLAGTLRDGGKHGDMPARIVITLLGAYSELDFQQSLDAGIVVRAR